MQVGMVGLGRMGGNLVRRLMAGGHDCVAFDLNQAAVDELRSQGAVGARSLEELASLLRPPRLVWIMIPAAFVDSTVASLRPHLAPGDVIIDGGNSFFEHDIRRAQDLARDGITYLDVGTSGGVHGLERGFCLMIGGDEGTVSRLDPIWQTLAPGIEAAPRTFGRDGPPQPGEEGSLRCGPAGAGHFVKMIHNGIEYGLMASYAEGLAVLERANLGGSTRRNDSQTAPLENPERYRFDLDVAAVAELWRRGSVITSWLLDLTTAALRSDPELTSYAGHVSDSGEGRWAVQTAVDLGVPVQVIASALWQRFSSRDEGDFADRALSAMRHQFGGHAEAPAGG
jgi:6-phosphogluconate dehydrogenase